jgi:hypothetical protein
MRSEARAASEARPAGAPSRTPQASCSILAHPRRCLPEAEDFQSVLDHYCSNSDEPLTDVLLIVRSRGSYIALTGWQGYSAGSLSVSKAQRPSLLPAACRFRRILVGFPLSALWILTFGKGGVFRDTIEQAAASGDEILALQGTVDEFTAEAKYRTWLEGLSQRGTGFSERYVAATLSSRRRQLSPWLKAQITSGSGASMSWCSERGTGSHCNILLFTVH